MGSEETQVCATDTAMEAESDQESHPGEGMLLKNPRSSVATEDIRLWRSECRLSMRGLTGSCLAGWPFMS